MKKLNIFLLAGIFIICTSCAEKFDHPETSIGIQQYPEARDLYNFAERLRKKHGLPALGVGIIRDGKIIGLGMAGVRRNGSDDWATLDDYFEVASCSKAVTATVAAILVERGIGRWDMTIKEIFPELQKSIRPDYANVTLDMLLRHRSGLDWWMSTYERWVKWHRDHAGLSATEKRLLFVEKILQHQPIYAPDTETYYTNDGYNVAGSMLERVSGKPWEELVSEIFFEPLDLRKMHLGVPASELSSVVWGHENLTLSTRHTRGAIKPDPDEYGDPPFGSPGGFLYCTVTDLLRFVDFHIKGANGNGELLSRDSFIKLHTPLAGQQYALGWVVETYMDGQGKIVERSIFHGGYSGRSRANMWFSPESRTGTVIVYNHGGPDKEDAYVDIFYALLKEFELLN